DMFRSVLPLIAAVLSSYAMGQATPRFTQENGDCTGAIMIPDSVFRAEHAVRGFGNKLEIKENPSDHKQWFEREHHTTWYKFRVPVQCKLTMDIIPRDPTDDIDFIIFEGAIPGICDKIASKQVVPVRSNISRNDPNIGSRCGLSKEAPDAFVRSGVGASYSSALEVEAGQLFYLVVDHQNPPRAGYQIRFHYDPPPPPPPVEEKKQQLQQLVINISDAKTGAPVNATLAIDGMEFDKVVEAKGKSTYEYDMAMYRNLKIGCTNKGYMFTTVRVRGTTDPTITVDIKLTPISAGERVVLDDIRFVGNEDKVMRQSEASLLLLLRFMQENPKVRIEVQGHVNGPTFKNKKEFIDLSTARAKTVYDFLLMNDVDPERISYQGLGNSQMLYPEPKNKEQSEANRRVEVKVLGT
ncbi:MAG TPA: OmpA family protein, partial [Flavobacteriales bacterium]|nr:OmpA family protein [Flavobacteriales bacterium]